MMTMMQRRGSSWLGLAGAIALVLAPTPAFASKTGNWTIATPYTSTTSNGVTVTMSSTVDFTSVAGGTMMSTNFWNDPYAAVPSSSIPGSTDINFIVQPVTTQTVTFTFSKAVNNPVLHIQRLGGSNSGLTNSSNWELTGSNLGAVPTLSRLSGNPQFTVTGNAFYRMPGISAGATGCSAASASATGDDATNGCGTVQVNGSGITSLTFTVTFLGGVGIGDGIELVWSIGGSRIAVRKQSVYGTGTFSFSGTNGLTILSLNTASANPATSSYFNVANHSQPLTITEAAASGFNLIGASCVDQSGVAVSSSLASRTLTIAAASYAANQDLVCTFVNRKSPAVDLTITKTNGVTSVMSGSDTTYTVVITNVGPDNITGAIITDLPGSGITCPSGNPVSISGSGVPSGSFTISNLISGGIALGTLNSGQSATLTYSCKVN